MLAELAMCVENWVGSAGAQASNQNAVHCGWEGQWDSRFGKEHQVLRGLNTELSRRRFLVCVHIQTHV